MREYLFRGKDIDGDGWRYGFYWKIRKDGKELSVIRTDSLTETFVIVDEATVGQYTGQKDRNGTLIFEGDILVAVEGKDGGFRDGIGVIRWDAECSCFECVHNSGRDDFGWLHFDELEVAGNVYDNPELVTWKAEET